MYEIKDRLFRFNPLGQTKASIIELLRLFLILKNLLRRTSFLLFLSVNKIKVTFLQAPKVLRKCDSNLKTFVVIFVFVLVGFLYSSLLTGQIFGISNFKRLLSAGFCCCIKKIANFLRIWTAARSFVHSFRVYVKPHHQQQQQQQHQQSNKFIVSNLYSFSFFSVFYFILTTIFHISGIKTFY